MRLLLQGELPHDEAAERAVLGSVLLDPRCLPDIAPIVAAEDFYHPAHQTLFEAILDLDRTGAPVDHLTVMAWLKSHGQEQRLSSVGGDRYLADLQLEVVTTSSIAFHGRAIALKAEARRWVQAMAKLVTTGLAGGLESEFLAEAEREILSLTTSRRFDASGPKPVKSVMVDVVRDIEARYERRNERATTGITSGLSSLDVFTLGWQPGEMTVIAGRPSMGKTSLAMCAAVEAARAGHPVLFFSLEMTGKSLTERIIAMEGNMDSTVLRTGHIDAPTWVHLSKSFGRIVQFPLWIDDQSGIRVGDIRSRARRWKLSNKSPAMPLVLVDYIGLVRPNHDNPKFREREVAEISAELKAMAKDLACPVIVLSQLNRSVESRSDKRPMQSDLRESGSIEQDADVIAFLYRDEYYHQDGHGPKGQCERCEESNKGVAEVIIAKQRNGPTGVAHVGWRAESTKFVNLSNRSEH
jgi:replicative DNA helicase